MQSSAYSWKQPPTTALKDEKDILCRFNVAMECLGYKHVAERVKFLMRKKRKRSKERKKERKRGKRKRTKGKSVSVGLKRRKEQEKDASKRVVGQRG